MEYELLTKALIVKPPDEPIFSDHATEIYLEDEAAGLFVVVVQRADKGTREIRIGKEEWPWIKNAVDQLMERC